MNVFWHHDYLAQTQYGADDIGRVIRAMGVKPFHVTNFSNTPVTSEEEDQILEGFATLAEARRFLEGVAKRLGYTLISRKDGWAEYMGSYNRTIKQ